jgi:hypothetical protein
MDSFEQRLDEIFVLEGKWKDTILPSLKGGALGLGIGLSAGQAVQQRLSPPKAPSHQEVPQKVDVHREYPKVVKKEEPVDLNKEKFPISEQEIKIVASTLILEAGGETEKDAMIAIMNVIHNRAGRDPKRYAEVCMKPLQFSCHNGRTPDNSIKRAGTHSKWEEAIGIVEKSLRGEINDVTGGADHYHVFQGPSECKPSWTHPTLGGKTHIDGRQRAVSITKYIGDHVFLKDVNKTIAKPR